MQERNQCTKTSVLTVHDEAVVETTPTPQPQEIGPRQSTSPPLVAIPLITEDVCPTTSKLLTIGELKLLESMVNGTDITALPYPNMFTGWNFEWTLNTCSVIDRGGTSEPVGETVALPNRQSLAEEGII